MLSDEKRQEKEGQLQRLMAEYDGFVQQLWGPGGKVARRNEELTRPIIAQVKTVLDKIAGEEGFDLVIDAADGNIVYGDPELDLTDRVLQELRQVE
jgi:Skp family chaperone for outer membrane proteins